MVLVKAGLRESFLLPLATAFGCLALILFFKHLTWPHDLYLASAFINFYINPDTYSPHDILISGAQEIPFLLYQGFGRLIQSGITLQEICYWGVCICLIMTFLPLWKIAFYITRNGILANIVFLLKALCPGNAGTLMSPPLAEPDIGVFNNCNTPGDLRGVPDHIRRCSFSPGSIFHNICLSSWIREITGLITGKVLLFEIQKHSLRKILIKGALAGLTGSLVAVLLIMRTLYALDET